MFYKYTNMHIYELICKIIYGQQISTYKCICVFIYASVQLSSVTQSCPTLCDPMNHSTPGLPVHHQLLEFTQTHIHQVSDAIQPSHPRSSHSSPAPNPSQYQCLFQWVNSSHTIQFHKVYRITEMQSFIINHLKFNIRKYLWNVFYT